MRHAVDVVDSLIVCESAKTLSVLNRQLLKPKDVYTLVDFFTYSPWNPDQLRLKTGYYLIKWALEHSYKDSLIFISIDDSMTKKPKESRHFEPVDWHHDHLGGGSSYSYGLGFITCRIQIGNCSFTVNHRLYMREKTVRQLNRSRPKEKRLKFHTKYSLARAMLLDLLSLIPKERKVYVLFDSWYSSAKLIKFCLRHKWYVISCFMSTIACLMERD